MSEAQLSTRDVASRLGISTSDLAELRLKTGELPIEQDGLKLFYSADTVQAPTADICADASTKPFTLTMG